MTQGSECGMQNVEEDQKLVSSGYAEKSLDFESLDHFLSLHSTLCTLHFALYTLHSTLEHHPIKKPHYYAGLHSHLLLLCFYIFITPPLRRWNLDNQLMGGKKASRLQSFKSEKLNEQIREIEKLDRNRALDVVSF